MPSTEGKTNRSLLTKLSPMGPCPSTDLPGGLRDMEREDGEGDQLLNTLKSNTSMLATYIHSGGESPRHNNDMERRKKNYLTVEERLQLNQFSAQKMLKVNLPQEKTKQNRTELRKHSSFAGYKLH